MFVPYAAHHHSHAWTRLCTNVMGATRKRKQHAALDAAPRVKKQTVAQKNAAAKEFGAHVARQVAEHHADAGVRRSERGGARLYHGAARGIDRLIESQ